MFGVKITKPTKVSMCKNRAATLKPPNPMKFYLILSFYGQIIPVFDATKKCGGSVLLQFAHPYLIFFVFFFFMQCVNIQKVHSKWITGPGPRMLKVLKTETYRMNCQTIYSDIMGSMYMKNHWSGRIGIGNTMGS